MKLHLPALALLAVSVTINVLALTGPLFMLQIYDRVLASRSIPTLVTISALALALYGFSGLLDALRSRMLVRLSNLIEHLLSGNVFKRVLGQRRTAAKTQFDALRDLETLRQVIIGGGPVALLDLPWLPFYLLILYLFHPLLAGVTLAGALMIVGLLLLSEFSLRGLNTTLARAHVARQRFHNDALANSDVIRAMGMTDDAARLWADSGQALTQAQRRAVDRASTFSAASRALRYILQSSALGFGAYLVIAGELTSGMMIGASMIASRAVAPLDQAVAQWRNLSAAREALRRIRALLADDHGVKHDLALPLPRRDLVVAGLSSGPSSDLRALVSGVSFSLSAGDGLGVLGPSGSGKTSLIKALAGIWPILSGEIRADGADLDQYDPERLGRAVGYLPQTVELFSGTIAQNIARFQPAASSEEIISAARAAHAHDFILAFENGYDTEVGELGSRLSAGQRQRIGLARALYGEPFLVLLDEPNANLDAEGDNALKAAIATARSRGAIVVVIAHRPTAIASLDLVLYLRDGRQHGFGPKDEMLRKFTAPREVQHAGVQVTDVA